MIILR